MECAKCVRSFGNLTHEARVTKGLIEAQYIWRWNFKTMTGVGTTGMGSKVIPGGGDNLRHGAVFKRLVHHVLSAFTGTIPFLLVQSESRPALGPKVKTYRTKASYSCKKFALKALPKSFAWSITRLKCLACISSLNLVSNWCERFLLVHCYSALLPLAP